MLSIFGDIETFVSGLYPYRYLILPLLLAAAAVAFVAAYRAGVHRALLRHRLATAAIALPLTVATLVAGNYLLSPLWERSYLEEASPLEAAAPVPTALSGGSVAGGDAPAAAPVIILPSVSARGSFRGADDFHFGRGEAQIITTAEGTAVLRFEDFSVRNGPDLYVYVSFDEDGKKVEEALNLGRLKATDGAFNYEIPASIDIKRIRSVIVWCRQFSTLFAVANLS